MKIANREIGIGHPCYVVAEIGINANGSVDLAKKLIDVAVLAGCDAVKFQKRSVDLVYSAAELDKPRESPWGTTNREQKSAAWNSVSSSTPRLTPTAGRRK
jgi:N-acetylneuraminate synthase